MKLCFTGENGISRAKLIFQGHTADEWILMEEELMPKPRKKKKKIKALALSTVLGQVPKEM